MGTPAPSSLIGVRHRQVFLMFLGLVVAYMMRVNLSVGMVAMTSGNSNHSVEGFPVINWTSTEKSTISSTFFWGYFFTQIPAGILAGKFGPSKLVGTAFVICGLTTLIFPLAAIYGGVISVCICRIVQGLGQGFLYPCVNTHLSKWVIPQERGRLFSFTFGGNQAIILMAYINDGTQFGTILMLLIGGVLAAGKGGWPSIYYLSGALGVVWGTMCIFFGCDSPSVHKTISMEERGYIENNLIGSSSESKKMKIPWKSISLSIPMWALFIDHMAQNWGFWTLLTFMPTYIHGVLHFEIEANGFLSSLPYIAMWIATFIFAYLSDLIFRKKLLPLNTNRKMWNSVAQYGGALALIALAYFDTGVVGAITLLTISVGLNAGVYNGFLTNHLDQSPNFAGTLMGITNGLSNVTSICGPLIVGFIVTDESQSSQWQIVFLISAVIFAAGNTLFIIFGSTDVQPWNDQKVEENHAMIQGTKL